MMAAITPVDNGFSAYTVQFVPSAAADGAEQASRAGDLAQDTAEFSPEALRKARGDPGQKSDGSGGLTAEQQSEVEKMKVRDQEVRSHEQAHIMAGGNLVRGGASYSYRTGPDGERYAAEGEVQIDSSPVDGDPRATMRKAQQVQRAALAPAQPSGQDLAVAASATSMQAKAAQELYQQKSSLGSVNKRA